MVQFVSTPWTAIVSTETFERVQAILLARRNEATESGRRDLLMLSGLGYCPCGSKLVVSNHNGDRMLICRTRRLLLQCDEPGVSLAVVERAVLGQIKHLLNDGSLDQDFLELVEEEAEARAAERRASRASYEAERDTVAKLIEDKLAAVIPQDPTIKEAWDRMMLDLGKRQRAADDALWNLKAAMPVTKVSGAKIGTLRDQIDELINAAPLLGNGEPEVRARAMLRSIIKRVDLVRHDDENGELKIVLDFNGEIGLADDPRARVSLAVPIRLGNRTARVRHVVDELIANGSRRPTPEQCDVLDASTLMRRGVKHDSRPRDVRERLYHALVLVGTTEAPMHYIGKALGLHGQTVSNLMREYRGVGDTNAIAELLASLRPDLVFDAKRFDGQRKKLHRSIKRRFELSHHPLMRHPLASTAPPEARLNDAQMDAVMAALKPGTYWTSRPAPFRRLLDALLIQLRTGCNFSELPVDIGEIQYARREYNFLHDEPLRLATRALLEHATVIEVGERLHFQEIPAYTSKHVEQDGWKSKKLAQAARAEQR